MLPQRRRQEAAVKSGVGAADVVQVDGVPVLRQQLLVAPKWFLPGAVDEVPGQDSSGAQLGGGVLEGQDV